MTSFISKKNIDDSLRDSLIMTIGTTGIFFGLKTLNLKPSKASLDAMDIVKRTGGIYRAALMKDYAVYRKWINE